MLYSSIKYISATLLFHLRMHDVHAGTITPNMVLYNDVDCGDSPQDICSITCDHVLVLEEKEKWDTVNYPNVYCGNTSKCIINCVSGWCLRESRIHANHTQNLELISHQEGKSCVQDASLFLPNIGNATLRGDSGGVTGDTLKEIIVYSGDNTDRIDIHCHDTGGEDTKNDCKAMVVHAEKANYVEITSNGAHLDSTKVFCPTNSRLSPSCIVNASDASSAKNIVMHATRGTPQDVMFYTDEERRIYTGSAIVCSDGAINSTILNTTFVGTFCHITAAPTAQLTAQPTRYPTIVPTYFPTIYPTNNPSANPSANPSTNPSANPSANPSTNPSTNPSAKSSTIKAVVITPSPTMYPIAAQLTANIIEVTMTTSNRETEAKVNDKTGQDNDFLPDGVSLDLLLFILILATVFAGCFLIGLYFANKKQQKHIVEARQNSERTAAGESDPDFGRKATIDFAGEAAKVVARQQQKTFGKVQRSIDTNIGSVTNAQYTPQTQGMAETNTKYVQSLELAQADAEYNKNNAPFIQKAVSVTVISVETIGDDVLDEGDDSEDESEESEDDEGDSDEESKQMEHVVVGEMDAMTFQDPNGSEGTSSDSDGMYNKKDDVDVKTPGFTPQNPPAPPPNNYNNVQPSVNNVPPPPPLPHNYNISANNNGGLADIVVGSRPNNDDFLIGANVSSF